jgi:hypothetical protein
MPNSGDFDFRAAVVCVMKTVVLRQAVHLRARQFSRTIEFG